MTTTIRALPVEIVLMIVKSLIMHTTCACCIQNAVQCVSLVSELFHRACELDPLGLRRLTFKRLCFVKNYVCRFDCGLSYEQQWHMFRRLEHRHRKVLRSWCDCCEGVIPMGALFGARHLCIKKLPAKLVAIDDYAFQGCVRLNLSDLRGVEHVGCYAFRGCSNMSFDLKPEEGPHLARIGRGAFDGCTRLQTFLPSKYHFEGPAPDDSDSHESEDSIVSFTDGSESSDDDLEPEDLAALGDKLGCFINKISCEPRVFFPSRSLQWQSDDSSDDDENENDEM